MFDNKDDCEECAGVGEKALAVIGILAGALIMVFAIDLLTDGKIFAPLDALTRKEEVTSDE